MNKSKHKKTVSTGSDSQTQAFETRPTKTVFSYFATTLKTKMKEGQ